MRNLWAFFRRLRWKLTLGYTTVTVGVSLIVAAGLTLVLFFFVLRPNDALDPEYWLEALGQGEMADVTAELLSQSPSDVSGIEFLIDGTDATISSLDVLRIGGMRLSIKTTARIEALILDADGNVLGATPGELATGVPLEVEKPLQAALAGEQDAELLSARRQSDGALIVAVPVFDRAEDEAQASEKHVLGVVVALIKSLPAQRDVWLSVLRLAGWSLLVFALVAGAVGTVFGLLTARGLAGRCEQLSQAADAWSQGDFTRLVQDRSGDELGQLARRMDRLAEELQGLVVQQQESAVLEEQNRLARILYDGVKQRAFAVSAQLGATKALFGMDPKAAKARLLEAEGLMDEARRELDDLIYQLRPVALGEGGLTEVLRDHAVDWMHRNNIEVDVQVQGGRPLLLEVEQALFDIAQEALANVARHSEANRVEVLLTYDANAVTLTIADDGQGFKPGGPRDGLGLGSMQERAEAVGATLTVESAPGQGTRISVSYAL